MSARKLESACETIGIELTSAQIKALLDYLALIIKWNRSYNLSAIRDPGEMLIKHLIDSLALVPLFSQDSGKRYLDVGTGAGLPGIPLSICFPDRHFSLLDSAGKKMRFLFQVKQSLKLENVELFNERVEQFSGAPGFDGIISRAFASVLDFAELSSPLLAENGLLWAMKGFFPSDELSALPKHYIVVDHPTLEVPGLDAARCVVRLRVAQPES